MHSKRNPSKIINKINTFFLWQGPWVLYCLFIFYLSSIPNPPDIYTFPLSDKIKHAFLYLFLALLTLRAFRKWSGDFSSRYYFIWAIFFCVLYGASDEWHQSFVANRDSNVMDWVADVIGTSIGGTIYWFHNKKK
ncbi:MAG: VanZ family protein [Candidatus Scalinduaceae bacterium]